MALDYLQLFRDKRELLEPFNREEKGELLEAMMAYTFEDVEIVLETNAKYVWPVFRQMIDQSKRTFEVKSNAGKRKGNQTVSDSDQSESDAIKADQTPSERIKHHQAESGSDQSESDGPINQESRIKNQESGIKNHREKGDEVPPTPQKAPRRFTPPSVEEVAAYCRERGNSVSPQRFVDFYAAKGWRVGSAAMKDWRAAVRTWEDRDEHPPDRRKTVGAQQYAQRSYTEAELTAVSDDLLAEAREARGGSP